MVTMTGHRSKHVYWFIGSVKEHHFNVLLRDNFVYVPSQWETTLQYNVVSHWLGACSEWSPDAALASWSTMVVWSLGMQHAPRPGATGITTSNRGNHACRTTMPHLKMYTLVYHTNNMPHWYRKTASDTFVWHKYAHKFETESRG